MNQNETIVPGRNYHVESARENVARAPFPQAVEPTVVNTPTKDNTPVVGFMYSISRQGIGEYWPIKLGRNTIGKASTCDIQLCEASISDFHASLNVKIMKSTGRLVASIRDEGSKTGLYLNDEELDYDNYPCKNLDVVVVGTSYRILIILVDAPEYGLTAAENFIATDAAAPAKSPVAPTAAPKAEANNDSFAKPQQFDFNDPFARPQRFNANETIGIEPQNNNYGQTEKTRCL